MDNYDYSLIIKKKLIGRTNSLHDPFSKQKSLHGNKLSQVRSSSFSFIYKIENKITVLRIQLYIGYWFC